MKGLDTVQYGSHPCHPLSARFGIVSGFVRFRHMEKVLNSGKLFFHTRAVWDIHRGARGCIVMATGVLNLGISGLEDYIMRHIDRYISSLLLAAAIAAPTAIMAHPRPQDGGVQVRIYDRDHRDYHNWDNREDRAYRRYLGEQHRTYRVYQRQHYRVQRHYWNWRHRHPE